MNHRKEQIWDFEAPKFWDFSETIPQERPTESWFCNKNVSDPSFGAPRKRRTLRVFKYSLKNTGLQQNPSQDTHSKRESVFERLSRESTVSFSRKTNQPLTPQQRHHEAQHGIEEDEDQELIVQPSKETVEERIVRLEGTYVDQGRPFGLGKKTLKFKQSINHSSHRQPQTLYEEMQKSDRREERTQEMITDQPTSRQIVRSPIRHNFSMSPPIVDATTNSTTSRVSLLSDSHDEKRTAIKYSPLRQGQPRAMSSYIPIQSGSPIQKPNLKLNQKTPSKVDKIVSNFFDGLLRIAKEKEAKQTEREEKARKFFDNLLKINMARSPLPETPVDQEIIYVTTFSKNTNTNDLSISPRKRTIAMGVTDYYPTERFKRSKFAGPQ